MRFLVVAVAVVLAPTALASQASVKWPPDSLVNVQVFPKTTPVVDVVGAMRNFAGAPRGALSVLP